MGVHAEGAARAARSQPCCRLAGAAPRHPAGRVSRYSFTPITWRRRAGGEGGSGHRGCAGSLRMTARPQTSATGLLYPYERTKIELMRKILRPMTRNILRVIETREEQGTGGPLAHDRSSRGRREASGD